MTGGALHGNNFFLHTFRLVSAVLDAVDRSDNWDPCFPFTGAITVGATDSGDELYDKNNWGSCVDVYAPGVSIISASEGLYSWSGTNTATAYVVGIVAGLLGAGVPAAEVASEVLGAASAKGVDPEYPETGIATIFDAATSSPTTSAQSTSFPTAQPTPFPTVQPTPRPTNPDCLLPSPLQNTASSDTGPLVGPFLAGWDLWDRTWVVDTHCNSTSGSLYMFYYAHRSPNNVVLEFFNPAKSLHEWEFAGLLIRETLDEQSKFFRLLTPIDLKIMSAQRSCTGCGASADDFGPWEGPVWIQLAEAGDTFSMAWRRENATEWTTLGSESISWSESFYAGIVLHNCWGSRPAVPEADGFNIRTS